jgi:hypothetical protein
MEHPSFSQNSTCESNAHRNESSHWLSLTTSRQITELFKPSTILKLHTHTDWQNNFPEIGRQS